MNADALHSSSPIVAMRSAIVLSRNPILMNAIQIIEDMYDISKYHIPSYVIKTLGEWASTTGHSQASQPKHEYLGKLGLKMEAAGKMRVFAMVDPWTQWLLAPIHKVIFNVLRKLPQDGTFDQLAPLKRAFDHNKPLFSMDLSSATDRLPISLQEDLIRDLFGLTVKESQAWRELLVGRSYALPKSMISKKNPAITSVTYSVGQPMGALSSWAMLAYTHHFIVQFAAVSSGEIKSGTWFSDYAVLGDDIVIFNARVAKKYLSIITNLGVDCNPAKSIYSLKGVALEFAKKTIYKGVDVSPIPIKEFYSSLETIPALIEFGRKYSLSFPQMVKSAGFGYKVLGGLNKKIIFQNLKIKYLFFASCITDPITFMESFKHIVFAKDSIFIRGFCLWVDSWINKCKETMVDEIGWCLEFQPSKLVKSYGYPYGLYEMIYLPYLDKITERRVLIHSKFEVLARDLADFVKFDVSYYSKRGLPLESEPIIVEEVSNLVWTLMSMYKDAIMLPISVLTFSKNKDLAAAFTKGKGVPSLFHQHQVFKNLLHSKDGSRYMEAGLPFGYLPILLRRFSGKRIVGIVTSQITRRLLLTAKTISLGSMALSFGAIIFGIDTVVATVAKLFVVVETASSAVDTFWNPLSMIMRIIILIIGTSGILFICKGHIIGPQIYQFYMNGWNGDFYDLGYEITNILVRGACDLLHDALPIALDTMTGFGFSGFFLGASVTWFILWTIRFVFGL